MILSMERLSGSAMGYMESPAARRDRKRPLCTLQHLDPEDLDHAMCDALAEDERRPQARTDAETFQLYLQFVRAHGLPKGAITTLSPAGVCSCEFDRRK